MPNFRPFSACWGDISFTQAPQRPHGATQGRYFFHATPREHPPRGEHRRNRAHLETQSLAAVLVGGGGAWPDNEPTHRAHISDQAPLVWRAPEGPEGTGGLRDRPLRAAGSRVAISRAAGPDGAQNTSGAVSNKLNREFRLHRRYGGRKRAWLQRPWAAARPGRHHTAPKAPLVWRAPEGLEGTGGLRDRPLRAAGSRVAISRAAGPDGARNTSGATQRQHAAPTASGRAAAHGRTKQPGPTAGPDGTRNTSGATSAAGNQPISGSRAPSGSPTRRQHPSARAGAPNRR